MAETVVTFSSFTAVAASGVGDFNLFASQLALADVVPPIDSANRLVYKLAVARRRAKI